MPLSPLILGSAIIEFLLLVGVF